MTLSAPLRKLLALALLALLIWSGHVYIAEPLLERWNLADASIARQAELERRYLVLGANRADLEQRLDRVGESLSPAGLYIEAASDALVGAELQNKLKSVVEQGGGILNSTQILPAAEAEPFRRIGVRVQMSGTVMALQSTLHKLESARPYLFLDNLDVRRRVARTRTQRKRAAPPESRLTVRFDLYGYASTGANDG